MLLWLADYLTQYHSGFNVFRYLTLRGILKLVRAFEMMGHKHTFQKPARRQWAARLY